MAGDDRSCSAPARHSASPPAWLAAGVWPDGSLLPDAPDGAVASALMCASVTRVCAATGWSIADLARELRLPAGEVAAMVDGEVLVSVEFVARIQLRTAAALWPTPAMVHARRSRGLDAQRS